jgi:mono/diheme cytochrome c family protein
MRIVALALLATVAALPAAADEPAVQLKPGSGLDKVEGNCGACHSLDYIPMNSPFLNAAGWNGEVTKMIKAFGAPINDADAKTIAAYLAQNYGVQ